MNKKYNALILDDNLIAGECIKKRIFKANSTNVLFSGIEIIPYFLPIDISNINSAAESIANYININDINFLLLDRGFYFVIDPNLNSNYHSLDNKYLYTKKVDLKSSIKIEQILDLIPKKELGSIEGMIIYTYDADEDYVEPAHIKQLYLNLMPEKFNKNNIEIILTNSEIYKLAGLNLYIDEELPNKKEMTVTGLKSDFKLYGLFMGEILYHRMISMYNKELKKRLVSKQKLITRNLIILYLSFTSLTIGGNALYGLSYDKIHNNYFLIFSSIVFALLLPLFILKVKPDLLIAIDNE